MKIALIKLSSIGDAIHALPLATSLKETFPHAHLEWIVQKEPLPLIEGHPAVDSTRVFPRKDGALAILSFLGRLWREKAFDLAIDAQGNTKSALVTLATRAKERIGFHKSNCREPLNRIATNRHLSSLDTGHIVDCNLEFSRALGWKGGPVRFGLHLKEEEVGKVRADLVKRGIDPQKATACFNIRPQSDVREWYAERYAALADHLAEDAGMQVLFTAGPQHRAAAERVYSLTRKNGIFNLGGENDLRELAALYALLSQKKNKGANSFFLGCDSAPLHLSVAVGLPVVGLYGSQNPARNGPYSGGGTVIEHIRELSCAPCRKRTCKRTQEPRACMDRIGVEEVWKKVQRTLL